MKRATFGEKPRIVERATVAEKPSESERAKVLEPTSGRERASHHEKPTYHERASDEEPSIHEERASETEKPNAEERPILLRSAKKLRGFAEYLRLYSETAIPGTLPVQTQSEYDYAVPTERVEEAIRLGAFRVCPGGERG